jgi:hypothetical protein
MTRILSDSLYQQVVEALSTGKESAETWLADRKQALAGWPEKYAAEERDVAQINAALTALRSLPVAGGEPTALPKLAAWDHLRNTGAWPDGCPGWARDYTGHMNEGIAAQAVIEQGGPAPTVAQCVDEETARRIVQCVNANDELVEAAQAYRDAQDALDNREYAGIHAEPYEVLMRRRNVARGDLDAAIDSALGEKGEKL